MSTSEMIRCNLIDEPPADKDLAKANTTFNKAFATNLAQSIKAEGMHQPIVVRPHPDKPGRYLRVFGRHRIYAVFVILKQEVIEAKVIVDMDETDAKMATISENLWRNPLNKHQAIVAIKKWWEYYQSKFPDKAEEDRTSAATKAAAKAAAARRAEAEAAPESEGGVATADDPEIRGRIPTTDSDAEPDAPAEPVATEANFTKMVSDTTGKGATAAKAAVKIAKAFTEEQLENLEQMGVAQLSMYAIANLDPDKRNAAVALVCTGMDPREAVDRVNEDPNDAMTRPGPGIDPDRLSNDEWFAHYCCGPRSIYDGLTNKQAYKDDCLFYRAITAPRVVFHKSIRKSFEEHKSRSRAAFYRLVARVFYVKHPIDWLACGRCKGAGKVNEANCQACKGDGYTVTMETKS